MFNVRLAEGDPREEPDARGPEEAGSELRSATPPGRSHSDSSARAADESEESREGEDGQDDEHLVGDADETAEDEAGDDKHDDVVSFHVLSPSAAEAAASHGDGR